MNKQIILTAGACLLLLFSFYPVDKQPFVLNNIPSAQAQATAQQKLLLVHFTARWCAPCQMMEENTWTHPDLIAYMRENAVAAKVDIENFDGLSYTHQYKVKNVPTLLVFSADGKLLGRYENSISASHLIKYLEQYNTPENRKSEIALNSTSHSTEKDRYSMTQPTPTLSAILEAYGAEQAGKEPDFWVSGEAAIIAQQVVEQQMPRSTTGSSWIAPTTHLEPQMLATTEAEENYSQATVSRFIAPISTQPDYQPENVPVRSKQESAKPNHLLYTVQLGAFVSKAFAEKKMHSYQQTQQQVWLLEPEELHDTYYRVIAGAFYTREQAKAFVNEMKQSGTDGFVRILPEQSAAYLSLSMR